MKVEWLPIAERDRADQLAYVMARNPVAAIRLGDAIFNAAALLSDFPRIGRTGRVSGTRELLVGGTPYILIYRHEDEMVVILRLLHSARQWPVQQE